MSIDAFLGSALTSWEESLLPERWLLGFSPEDGKGKFEWKAVAGLLEIKVLDRALSDAIEAGEIALNDFADPLRIYATSLPRSY
ncbi:MAG: hypothetical protein ACI4QD_07950 [Kiritimatiellia bacterium]